VGVDDREDAFGERLVREAEPRPDRRQRPLRGLDVELHAAAEEELRVEPAEVQVRVRHRRLRAPAPVAGGAGDRARALRSDPEAAGLEPGERAAPGTDRMDVDE